MANDMQAAVITEPRLIEIQQSVVPAPQAHQVTVRLEGCGVCGSNLPVWQGRDWFDYPQEQGAPGHEGWGQIVQVGDGVKRWSVGDRVAALSYHAYAEYDVADADAVAAIPAELAGHPFPGEPLACAMNVFDRSHIEQGQKVAIIGIGFLGALLTSLAVNAGAEVIAITRRPFALEVARNLGAAHTIPMNDHWEIIERVKELTGDAGCDVVVEAVGQQWPLDLAAELTRIRGRLVIAGYHQDGLRQVNMQLWNWRGLDVINAHERDQAVYVAGMQRAVEFVQSGKLDPSPLYTHSFALDELDRALEMMEKRPDGFLKALIVL